MSGLTYPFYESFTEWLKFIGRSAITSLTCNPLASLFLVSSRVSGAKHPIDIRGKQTHSALDDAKHTARLLRTFAERLHDIAQGVLDVCIFQKIHLASLLREREEQSTVYQLATVGHMIGRPSQTFLTDACGFKVSRAYARICCAGPDRDRCSTGTALVYTAAMPSADVGQPKTHKSKRI